MVITAPIGPAGARWRAAALGVLCTGMLMVVLDTTIVNVALPTIQQDLGLSTSSLAWVVNAYLVAVGGFLLLAGRVGDLVGRRKVFLLGVSVFTLASLGCGLAANAATLIVARFAQGAGGAMTTAHLAFWLAAALTLAAGAVTLAGVPAAARRVRPRCGGASEGPLPPASRQEMIS